MKNMSFIMKYFPRLELAFPKLVLVSFIIFVLFLKIFAVNSLFLPVEYSFSGKDPESFVFVESSINSDEIKTFPKRKSMPGGSLYQQLSVMIPITFIEKNPNSRIFLKVGPHIESRLLQNYNKEAFGANDAKYVSIMFPSKNLILNRQGYDYYTNVSLFHLFVSVFCNFVFTIFLLFLIFKKWLLKFVRSISKSVLLLALIGLLSRIPWVFLLRLTNQWLYFYDDNELLTQFRVFPESWLHSVVVYGLSIPLFLSPVIKSISYTFISISSIALNLFGNSPLFPLLLNVDIWFSTAVFSGSVSAFLGASSIILIYLIGEMLWDKKAAFIAALLLFLDPGHLSWSTIPAPDVPAGFLLLLNFYYFLKIKENGTNFDFIKLSFLSALLIGTKIYNAIFIIVPVLGLVWEHGKKDNSSRIENYKNILIKLSVYMFATSVLLIIMNPYIITSNYLFKLSSPLYLDGVILNKTYSWQTFTQQISVWLSWMPTLNVFVVIFGILISLLFFSFDKFLILVFLFLNLLFFKERLWVYYFATWMPLIYVLSSDGLSRIFNKIGLFSMNSNNRNTIVTGLLLIAFPLNYYFNVTKQIPSVTPLNNFKEATTIGCTFIINDDPELQKIALLSLPYLDGKTKLLSIFDYPDYILSNESMNHAKRSYFKIKNNSPVNYTYNFETQDYAKRFSFMSKDLNEKYDLFSVFSLNKIFYEVSDIYYLYKKKSLNI